MKVTILGLPQAGHKELFSVLTKIPLSQIQQKINDVQIGICDVYDPRMTRLVEMYNPKKTTYAKIDYMLLPDFNMSGLTKDLILSQLKNSDEMCFVASEQSGQNDISSFISELIISDLVLIEKRLENIEKEQKRKATDALEKEKQLILDCKSQLEDSKLLQKKEFSQEQLKLIRTYQFLTMKPIILVINVDESQIKNDSISKNIENKFNIPCIQLCAKLEEEINQLDENDREIFMKELGVDEPVIHKMTRMAFLGLGMITFFTVGEDEVRSWPVRIGSTAPEAGRVIHSDIEKGFVRAEMYKYNDFIEAGSEIKLKETGKFYVKGRDYIVEDGDILSFRFNV